MLNPHMLTIIFDVPTTTFMIRLFSHSRIISRPHSIPSYRPLQNSPLPPLRHCPSSIFAIYSSSRDCTQAAKYAIYINILQLQVLRIPTSATHIYISCPGVPLSTPSPAHVDRSTKRRRSSQCALSISNCTLYGRYAGDNLPAPGPLSTDSGQAIQTISL